MAQSPRMSLPNNISFLNSRRHSNGLPEMSMSYSSEPMNMLCYIASGN